MRRILPVLAILLALTPLAHADQLDDFHFVSFVTDLSFTLPSTQTVLGPRDPIYFAYYEVPATLNGRGGFLVDAFFITSVLRNGSARFITIDPVLHKDDLYILYGGSPQSITVETGPGVSFPNYYPDITNTFLPGTYTGLAFNFSTYDLTPYTLTVTPEANTDVTPEPASLALLATGCLGLSTILRRRRANSV